MRTFICLLFFLFLSNSIFSQIITPAGPVSFCGSGTLTVSGYAGSPTFQWQRNTVNIPGATLPTYLVTTSGSYRVILSGPPSITVGPVSVTINPNPIPTFTFTNNNTCSHTNIQFTSGVTSGTPGFTYLWDFGDGGTSSSQNPSHSYNALGCGVSNFTVVLTVTDANGCSQSVTHLVTVRETPDVQLTDVDVFYPFSNCQNSPTISNPNYTLTVNNTSPSAACIVSYSINWGDGSPAQPIPSFPVSHLYAQLGAFNLVVTAIGSNGCSNTHTYLVANQSNPAGGLGTLGFTTNLCAPATIPFVISNWQNNSPGTIYVVNFGDNTSITLTHPLNVNGTPDTIQHTYTISSCPTPTFTATLLAINACDSTPYTAGNIQVRIAPIASFTVSPNPACEGQNVCFTNTTVSGYFGPNCNSLTAYSWNFGDPGSGPNNISTDANPCHIFSTAGTYSVTLTATNPCGSSTFTSQVCVAAPPVPAFTLNNNSGCSPLAVTATNTSVTTNSCGTPTYLWSVTYTAGFCGTIADWVFTGGSTASSVSPSFLFTGSGTYTITLSITNPCGTFSSFQTVTVKRPPIVTIDPIAGACIPAAVHPLATITNCGSSVPTILWSFPGGTPNSSSSADPGIIVYNTAGNYTITLTVTNECGNATATTPVAVNATPVPIVPANVIRCSGTSVGPLNLTSATPGATISWTNSNPSIGLPALGNGSPIPVFTTTNTGSTPITATITATASLNGCSSPASFTITVNPIPLAPVVTSPVNYCQNIAATPLSATAAAGNTLLWYNTATGGTGSSTAPTPLTTATGTFIYYVSQVTTATGCEGPRSLITVNVNPSPNISGSSQINPNSCGTPSGSITLTGLGNSVTYTVSYSLNGIPQTPLIITSTASGVVVIPNLTSGIYNNIIVTSFGCPSNSIGPLTLTDPSTPATPTVLSNSPLCAGNTLNLSSSTSSVGTVTYTWTGPSGFNSNLQNPTISNVQPTATGTYFVTATINSCISLPGSVSVIVNPTPATPTIGSNSPVCTGNSLNLTSSVVFAGPVTYSWSGPNSFTSISQNPVITNVTTANSGNYIVTITATTGNCPSPQANTLVIINPTPVISNGVSANPTACSTTTGSVTLFGLSPNTNYTVNYTFNTVAQTANILSNGTGALIITNLAAGTYADFSVILNGCQSNIVGPFTLIDPTPPATPVASNSGPVCSGGSLTLTSTVAPPGATYNWSGPGGFTSNAQNPVINSVPVGASGSYTLSITLNACTSAAVTTTVLINETPATPTANNNSPICTGNSLNLSSSTTFLGPVTYTWTGPGSYSSSSQNPVIPNVTISAAGTYSVTATSTANGCISAQANTIVVVNATPNISPGGSINPLSCSSGTGSITINGLNAGSAYSVTYTLDGGVPTTINISANASGQIVIAGLTSGIYSGISVSILGCPSNIIGPVTLSDPNPPAPPVAGSNSSICLGATLNLTATSNAVGTITYSWSGPNGFTSSLQNPTITGITAAAAGMYYVNIEVNNCTSLNDSVLVVINPLGLAPVAATPVSYCKDVTAPPLVAIANPSNTLNWYNVPSGGSPLPSAPTPVTTAAGTTNYYVSQTTALGCEGPRTNIEVIINPDAKALFDPTDTIGCPQFVLTPAIVNLQLFPANNSIYEWYANGTFIGSGAVFPGYTIINENDVVTIKLKAISLFGCKDDSLSRNFYTYNLPHPAFTKSDSVGCAPLIVQFQNTTPNITQFNYFWDFGNGQTSSLEQPGPITFLSNPTYNDTVYIIKLKVLSICDTLIFSDSVRVKSKPRALYTPSITTGCSPMHVLFTNTSGGNNNTYNWNFDDGTTFVTNSNDTFTHTFYTGVVDTFYVQLLVVNECGSDSISYAIIVAPNNIQLNLSFNGTDAFGCAPHTVAFINNSVGAGSFNWNFGDGNSTITVDNIDTVFHTYLIPGTFAVSVNAQNNCSDTTVVRYITVYPKPIAAFTASQYNLCIGQTVQFTNQSDSANAYIWQFGDGITSSLPNPVHSYSTAGIFTVTLYSYHNNPDGSSCIDSINTQIQVTTTLPGNISLSATSGTCVPFAITFVNHNIPSIVATWDFGDGFSATGDSVIHTYLTPGVFTVTATVTAPGGCTFVSTQIVTISGPTGSLLYPGGFVCYPAPVRFEAVATGTNSLLWNFGDGNTLSTTQLVVFHNYTNPGVYIPSVTLQSTGCNFPILGLDTIKVDKIDPGFSWTEQKFCGYSNISFIDTSSVFFGTSSINWDFGDGNIGTGTSVTHQYLASGNYNIVMVVIGNSGCTDTVRKQLNLQINNIPVVSIIGDAVRCANDTVNFLSNIVSANPLSITQWTLSNGVIGNASSFSYFFNLPGTYSLQFIAGTVNGCFDTAYHTIIINPVPIVTSSAGLTLCLGNSAQLQASGPSPLQWTPIQGLSCTSCSNPIATPNITTPYIVSGTNNFGCLGYDTTVITVIQPLNLTVAPDDSICIGQSTNLLASGATSYQWSPATGLNSTIISNPTANPTITTRYRVVGYDGYNCFTDTAYVLVAIGQYPTVGLGPDLTLSTGTMHPLTSVITNGPIGQWLWEPSVNLSCADCSLPVAEVKTDITYKVTVTTEYGCQATDAINIRVFCIDAQVFIPNAFTPNGDGKNDILMVRGKGIVTVKYFRIFNRWGEVVFEKNNFPPNEPIYGWDGKIKGKFCPPGVFVYTAGVICENGTPYEYKGNTTVIK